MRRILALMFIFLMVSSVLSVHAYNSPYGREYYYNEGARENAYGRHTYLEELDDRYAFDSSSTSYRYQDDSVDYTTRYRTGVTSPFGSGSKYVKSFDRGEYDQYYHWYTNSYSNYENAGLYYYEDSDNYREYVKPNLRYTGPAIQYEYTYQRYDAPGYGSRPVMTEYENYFFNQDNSKFYNGNFGYRPFGLSGANQPLFNSNSFWWLR